MEYNITVISKYKIGDIIYTQIDDVLDALVIINIFIDGVSIKEEAFLETSVSYKCLSSLTGNVRYISESEICNNSAYCVSCTEIIDKILQNGTHA